MTETVHTLACAAWTDEATMTPCGWTGTTADVRIAGRSPDDEDRGDWIEWACPRCGAAHEDLVAPDLCPATGERHAGVYEDGGRDGPSGWHCDECGASLPAPQRSEP